MKLFYTVFILILLIQCYTKGGSLNGLYTSISSYPDGRHDTVEIQDSLVIVDRIVLGANERDTIVIDPGTNRFVRVKHKSVFPIFDFKKVLDTIEVHYEHDLGTIKLSL